MANALLAVFGALARLLNSKDKGALRVISFVSGCVVAAFMGVIIYFLTASFDIDKNIAYAAAGISGWLGPQVLDRISEIIMKKAGLEEKK
jgi:hypothetical protein